MNITDSSNGFDSLADCQVKNPNEQALSCSPLERKSDSWRGSTFSSNLELLGEYPSSKNQRIDRGFFEDGGQKFC